MTIKMALMTMTRTFTQTFTQTFSRTFLIRLAQSPSIDIDNRREMETLEKARLETKRNRKLLMTELEELLNQG